MLTGSLLFLFLSGFYGQITASAAEKLVQQREGVRLAVNFIVIVLVGIVRLSEDVAHFIADHIQIFLRDSHLLHRIVNLRNSETSGALQAIALIHGYTVLNSRNKQNRHVLFAFHTHFRLH